MCWLRSVGSLRSGVSDLLVMRNQDTDPARVSVWSRVADVGIACAVAILAAVVVRREFFPSAPVTTQRLERPTFVSQVVDSSGKVGRVSGVTNARVRVMVFDDLECPFCAKFHTVLQRSLKEFSNDLSAEFVHFPLGIHRFARPAAVAAECAATFGMFDNAISTIFEKQDSLGLAPWNSLARDAGVHDSVAFEKCRKRSEESFPKIAGGLSFGKSLSVNSTPTVFVNGWRLPHTPDEAEISRIVRAVKSGEDPFKGESSAK